MRPPTPAVQGEQAHSYMNNYTPRYCLRACVRKPMRGRRRSRGGERAGADDGEAQRSRASPHGAPEPACPAAPPSSKIDRPPLDAPPAYPVEYLRVVRIAWTSKLLRSSRTSQQRRTAGGHRRFRCAQRPTQRVRRSRSRPARVSRYPVWSRRFNRARRRCGRLTGHEPTSDRDHRRNGAVFQRVRRGARPGVGTSAPTNRAGPARPRGRSGGWRPPIRRQGGRCT